MARRSAPSTYELTNAAFHSHERRETWLWSGIVFLVCSALYFLTRSPALDEWDSVQFALGATRGFDLFTHQPHPPGYPFYVFSGWLAEHILGLRMPAALQLGSALGGGLFVASWFMLAARGASGGGGDLRLAGLLAVGLAVLPVTWMTATKVLTDAPAAGFLALQLAGAVGYRQQDRRRGALVLTALAGALAAGVRPQNTGIALLVLGLALGRARAPRGAWLLGLGTFVGGCLVWLVPTMMIQAHCPEAGGSLLAYPRLLWWQWTWRLDQPKAFVGAAGQTGARLAERVWLHFGGWFTRGFAFAEFPALGAAGFALLAGGWALAWRRPAAAWVWATLRPHWPWAAAYVVMVFCCLPPDQRYYLPVFPLLLLPSLAGWWGLPGLLRWTAPILPELLLVLALPLAWRNHRELPPPVRLVQHVQGLHPATADRAGVWMILRDSWRHGFWYAPECRVMDARWFDVHHWPEDWREARAIYTDDPALVALPAPEGGWVWRPVAEFSRSPLIYRKHNHVALFRLERVTAPADVPALLPPPTNP